MPDGPSWFSLWAMHHARSFGLSDVEAAGMLEWGETLASVYGETELREATAILLRQPARLTCLSGKTLERHLEALRRAIIDLRAVEARSSAFGGEEDLGSCTICQGAGRVKVPNLVGVRNGEWLPASMGRGSPRYYTYAVLCRCAIGRWIGGRLGDRVMLSLDAYESQNSRWRVQMDHHDRELLAISQLSGRHPQMDELWKKLREKFKIPES